MRSGGFLGAAAHFRCSLLNAARPQQLLERPADIIKINCRVRYDARDRPRATFCQCRCCACCRCDMLTLLFVACVTQIFDSQQRATRLHTFTDGLRSVSDWSWRHVTRARVVATAGPLLRSCPRVRLYVRLRVVLAATEAECIGYRSPVDVPVKKSALGGVYMSRPLTSTQPKRKLSVGPGLCNEPNKFRIVALFPIYLSQHDVSSHWQLRRTEATMLTTDCLLRTMSEKTPF